jgi:hypothetical protein
VLGRNRTVVFDVAGTIALTGEIHNSRLVHHHRRAQRPGHRHHASATRPHRPGPRPRHHHPGTSHPDARQDGIWVTDGISNVLIEHVSVHNSADGNIDITRDGTRDVTVA